MNSLILISKITKPEIPSWWSAVLPLLLAALFASIQLDDNAFNRDEFKALYSAGIYESGPATLPEVWRHAEQDRPNQARGWSLLLFFWGRLAGWSEPAIRSLSLFAGLLAIASLYRASQDLLSSRAGQLAALLASTSVFLLASMAIARGFTLVVLFTTLILWSYGRLILARPQSGTGTLVALWAGTVALLYTHYLASLFLAAGGIYHLLFVRKDRRWWQVTLLLLLALLVGLIQLPGFLDFLSSVGTGEDSAHLAMTAFEVPGQVLYILSNFLVRLSWPAGALFITLLVVLLLFTSGRRLRGGPQGSSGWMLVFVTATAFLIMVMVNELARSLKSSRTSFVLPLLAPVAMLAGNAMHRYLRTFPRGLKFFMAFWLIFGPVLVLTEAEIFTFRHTSTFHHVQRILSERASTGDLVVLESALRDREVPYLHQHYFPLANQPWDTVFWASTKTLTSAAPVHSPYLNLWLVYPTDMAGVALTPENAPGRLACERLEDVAGFTVVRYGRAAAGCENERARLAFDNDILLTVFEPHWEGDHLLLETGLLGADDYLLSQYSLAIHVIDPGTGERVAQGDVGAGAGKAVSLRSEIDVSALPPGDYELHVALYDWQTGERLKARDVATGAVSDMHVLQRFSSG